MTDLRTAAQAIDAAIFQKGYVNSKNKKDLALIEALRQALDAPVEPVATIFFSGPIGYFWVDTLEMGERILHYMKVDDDDWTATNTTPPSVDALIAAGTALYMAGRWSCDQPVNEAKLWENLRDALMLPTGTETERARGQK